MTKQVKSLAITSYFIKIFNQLARGSSLIYLNLQTVHYSTGGLVLRWWFLCTAISAASELLPRFRLCGPNRWEGDHPKAQRRDFLPRPLCPLCPLCPAVGKFGQPWESSLEAIDKRKGYWNFGKNCITGCYITIFYHQVQYLIISSMHHTGVYQSLWRNLGGPNIEPFTVASKHMLTDTHLWIKCTRTHIK